MPALLLAACGPRVPPSPGPAAVDGPWEHAWVELPGRAEGDPLRMHYLAAGPVDAPRVVLLHGFPDLSYGWRHVLPLLAEDHRVLAPDLRGYGGTDKPDADYGVRTIAGDVAAFIGASAAADRRPEDAPVHLIGHDWGSATAWWVAMDHPERLRSLTAISVGHPLAWRRFLEQDAEQRRDATYQKRLAAPGFAGLLGALTPRQLGGLYSDNLARPEAFTDEQLAVYVAAFPNAAAWRPPLRYYRQLRDEAEELDAAAAAAGPVRMPVLVLWGEQDAFLYPRQAPMSCEHVAPGPCEVEVFEGTGHFPQWDLPGPVTERWRAFIDGLPKG